jgi:PTH1 family peptidyl-tRNA hydrolase
MLLFVGLGNPGPRYAGNRHNIGFRAIDEIARRYRFSAWRGKFSGEIADGQIGGERVLALKPMTYMNASGRSVGEAVRFHKIDPGAVTVFYDELDLAPAKLRVKTGGGHGGHNGVRDLIAHLGPDFRRVRLGIGHPGAKELVHGYVLQDFAKAELPSVDKFVDAIAAHVPLLVAGDEGAFMSKVSLDLQPPKPPKPPQPAPVRKDNPAPARNDDDAEAGED